VDFPKLFFTFIHRRQSFAPNDRENGNKSNQRILFDQGVLFIFILYANFVE